MAAWITRIDVAIDRGWLEDLMDKVAAEASGMECRGACPVVVETEAGTCCWYLVMLRSSCCLMVLDLVMSYFVVK